jgi:hypothetical protein
VIFIQLAANEPGREGNAAVLFSKQPALQHIEVDRSQKMQTINVTNSLQRTQGTFQIYSKPMKREQYASGGHPWKKNRRRMF